jgi:hypothetical protein
MCQHKWWDGAGALSAGTGSGVGSDRACDGTEACEVVRADTSARGYTSAGMGVSARMDTSAGRGASAGTGTGVGNDGIGDRACDGAEASKTAGAGVPPTAHSRSTMVARPPCMPASKHGWTDGEHLVT